MPLRLVELGDSAFVENRERVRSAGRHVDARARRCGGGEEDSLPLDEFAMDGVDTGKAVAHGLIS